MMDLDFSQREATISSDCFVTLLKQGDIFKLSCILFFGNANASKFIILDVTSVLITLREISIKPTKN